MTFTYPLDFPDNLTIEDFELTLNNSASENTSPFDLSQQVYDYGGEMWVVTGAMPIMLEDNARIYSSFKMKLKGIVGTFTMPIPDSKNPKGQWGGTPVVDGASNSGNTLNLRGLPSSVSKCAGVGDFISYGSGNNTRLHRVVDDADSDASGEMTVNIVPAIKTSPADGTAITYQNAKGVFKLTENQSGYGASPSAGYTMDFSCREYF